MLACLDVDYRAGMDIATAATPPRPGAAPRGGRPRPGAVKRRSACRDATRLGPPRGARAALVDWYRRLAASRLPEDTARWAQKLGVAVPRVIVSEPEKRWGSCSKGVVRLNWRILQAPVSLIDYVVAHEVTHLLHEDHSRTFWATLGRVMPDYEARKVRLRELGPSLVW
jgi:predicted metal-dependent hydrolase